MLNNWSLGVVFWWQGSGVTTEATRLKAEACFVCVRRSPINAFNQYTK